MNLESQWLRAGQTSQILSCKFVDVSGESVAVQSTNPVRSCTTPECTAIIASGIRMSPDLNPPPFYSTSFDLHPDFDVELILKFNNLEIRSCFRPCFYCRGIISTDTTLSSFDISMWMFLFNPWLQQIKLHKYYSYIYRGCVWQVSNYTQVNLHNEIFLLKMWMCS